MYASSVGKLLERSSVTGYRVSKYDVNRVNSGTFNHRLLLVLWTRPKRFKMFYYETTPVESKTFWIFVQCGRALSFCKTTRVERKTFGYLCGVDGL